MPSKEGLSFMNFHAMAHRLLWLFTTVTTSVMKYFIVCLIKSSLAELDRTIDAPHINPVSSLCSSRGTLHSIVFNPLKSNWRQVFPFFFLSQYFQLRLKNPNWANKRYVVRNQIFYKFFVMLNRRPFWKRSDSGHVM